MMEGLAFGFALAAFAVACCAGVVAAWAIAEVTAYKRSTHQVQFVSADDEAREVRDDRRINRELTDAEYSAMLNAFGDKRVVAEGDEK